MSDQVMIVLIVIISMLTTGLTVLNVWYVRRWGRAMRRISETRHRGGYISPKMPVSSLPKVPAGPAPGASAPPPPMHVDVNLISNAEGDKRAIQRTRDRAADLHQPPRCRTCNHERVDGPRCDYCGTVAGIHAGQP